MDMRPVPRTVAILAAVGLALALGACAADDGGPTAAPSVSSSDVAASGLGTADPAPSLTPVPAGSAPTGGTRTGPPHRIPPAGQLVSLRRSGGLAGLAQTVVVSGGGAWTLTDARQRGVERAGQLTADQRRQLTNLLTRSALSKEAKVAQRQPPKCGDAFIYTLTTGELTVRWSDCAGAGQPQTAAAIANLLELWTPLQGGI